MRRSIIPGARIRDLDVITQHHAAYLDGFYMEFMAGINWVMYRKILVALENSEADRSLIPHVAELGKRLHSHLLLVHVADGWVARNYDQYKLTESAEMKADRDYLERTAAQLRAEGLAVSTQLALGDPPAEILKTANDEDCDLIAMTSHGHRFLADLLLGSTIHVVRHKTSIPVLLVRAGTGPSTDKPSAAKPQPTGGQVK